VNEFQILCGDCREVMKTMPANSVDVIVTDPPYGLGFMGKDWDHGVPGAAFWSEMLRVLKPGGHLLAFGGSRTYHRMACAIEDAGWEIRDCIMWLYGSGFPKSHNLSGDHQGWGTALKPAHEPICVARKPFASTVAANVMAHGTGALNIDACRVGYENDSPNAATNPLFRKTAGYANGNHADAKSNSFALKDGSGERNPSAAGRWPANVIHDGSQEVLAAFPQAAGQLAPVAGSSAPSEKTNGIYGRMRREGEASVDSANNCAVGFKMKPGMRRLDAGSAARFFYCAKASKSDREDGNIHPTVKPTALMRYLCRLVTPVGGVVLDPFAGSGSTGKAAVLEGFQFIGIEREPEYVDIARARISAALGAHADAGILRGAENDENPRQMRLSEVSMPK